MGWCSAVVARADVVTDWNAVLRLGMQEEGNSAGNANPGWSTRAMAMMNGAIYDCFQAIERTHQPFAADLRAPATASKAAAAAQAAHDLLVALYASQADLFDAQLAASLEGIPDGPDREAGIALGAAAALHYLEWRADDGADSSVPYEASDLPGRWRPDPLHPDQEAWGPAWRSVRPFTLESPAQFAPPSPPALDSPAYTLAYQEVKELGRKDSAIRTPEQTEIGFFWAYDRSHMGPPPVFYNRNVEEISVQMGNSPEENARLFAMVSVAMADAAIGAWDCKYLDDFWRPVTGIREGDTDGNEETEPEPGWEPLGAPELNGDNFTPPFPAYVSGHATMGEAAYRILAVFYGGDEVGFRLSSEELPGIERTYTHFSQASAENAWSRIYLGIHWNFDATEGMVVGRQVADYVAERYFLPIPQTLEIVYRDGNVVLSWEGEGHLQQSSVMRLDSWEDLPGATSPFEQSVVEARERYFRLAR